MNDTICKCGDPHRDTTGTRALTCQTPGCPCKKFAPNRETTTSPELVEKAREYRDKRLGTSDLGHEVIPDWLADFAAEQVRDLTAEKDALTAEYLEQSCKNEALVNNALQAVTRLTAERNRFKTKSTKLEGLASECKQVILAPHWDSAKEFYERENADGQCQTAY